MSGFKNFVKCHGYKLVVIAAMLALDTVNLVYRLNTDFNSEFAWFSPYVDILSSGHLIVDILMFIPPVILAVHVIRRRKEPFTGYNDRSLPIIAVFKALGFLAGFCALRFILELLIIFVPTFVSNAS